MAAITLAQAISNAFKAERAAEAFYRKLAERTADPGTRQFLELLAGQEEEHAVSIEEFGALLRAGELSVGSDWNVEMIETAPEWAMHEGLDLRQAMDIALENEQHAELFYDAMADSAQGGAADFLRTMSRAEGEHYRRIKKMIEEGL